MSGKVSVIIPFFQQTPGILNKAVLSALRQNYPGDICIIVVDDNSPISAKEELQPLLAQYPDRITILVQPNAGPSAARNRGLDSISPDTEYVAFLDSDDEWMDFHIENAVKALGRGYNFYFSDFYFQFYKQQSAFRRAGKIPLHEHRLLDAEAQIYEYQGSMFDQILVKGNVIGTSTVVYRYSRFQKLRFRSEFSIGEDYFFWLDCAAVDDKIVFSSQIECDCGAGVNIYSGAGWGTDKSLVRMRNEIRAWKAIAAAFTLTPEQAAANKRKIAGIRENLVRNLFHYLRRGRQMDAGLLISLFKMEPWLPLASIPVVTRTLIAKFRGSRE